MKIIAFVTIFARTLAAPVDTSIDLLATTKIIIESTNAMVPDVDVSDGAYEDILDYTDEEYEACLLYTSPSPRDRGW